MYPDVKPSRGETDPSISGSDIIEMRGEIDRLRREVQELSRQLDDSTGIAHAVRQRWRQVRRRLLGAPAKLRRKMQTPRAKSAAPPYRVRALHPAQAQRRRVLHIIANFYTGGSSRLIVDLIEGLGHLYDQTVVARDLPPHPAYEGVPLTHIKQWGAPQAALKFLRDLSPEIVHVHYLGHRRNEYSIQDWRWYRHCFEGLEQYDCRVIENVNIPVDPYYSPCVNCYVHVSNYVRRRFAFNDAANLTIYPGSDLSLFRREKAANVLDDHIGMVYRLEGDKLDESSIQVFIEVVRRRPQTRVSIVGGGSFLEHYRRAVDRAGLSESFFFPGYVAYDELPKWLAQMSVFVAPVHHESFGQISVFAMGMQLPVTGYSVGALEEITAAPSLLAPAGDAKKLAAIICDLLNDRRRRIAIGEENRRRAHGLFSVSAMVAAYSGLYERMIKRSLPVADHAHGSDRTLAL
jgi:glycosyltransferase involved in cell wall biosynthesis